MNRLGDKIRGIQLQRLDSQFHFAVAGDDNHLGVRAHGLDAPQDLYSVQARHLNVGQDDLRSFLLKQLDPPFPVYGNGQGVAGIPQGNSQQFPDPFLVINQQYLGLHN